MCEFEPVNWYVWCHIDFNHVINSYYEYDEEDFECIMIISCYISLTKRLPLWYSYCKQYWGVQKELIYLHCNSYSDEY